MKKIKKTACVLAATLALATLGGCGKKDSVDPDKFIDKYSKMCDLGEYKGVEYTKYETVVTDEMLEQQIDSFLSQYATNEKVTSGKAKKGDIVNIDFVGTVDGVEFDGGSTMGGGYDLELGSNSFIDDFEDQIVGHEVGDSFDVEVTFPQDYGKEDLNGKDAVFAVTLNYITVVEKPEYNDDFIASNTDYATVDEYETSLRDNMEKTYADSDDNYNKTAIMNVVVDNTKISEYPEQEAQDLIDETVENVQEEADQAGYDLATYVTARYGFAGEDDFRTYVTELVEDYLKEKIVVCAIAKAENITVSKDEIKDYKQTMIEKTGLDEDDIDDYYDEEDIMYYAISEKVVNFLLENGKGVSPEEAE